jgi:hypothetical protein
MKTSSRKKQGGRSARRRGGNGQSRFSLARNLDGLGTSARGAVRSGRQAMSSAYRMASGLTHSLPSPRDLVPQTPRNLQKLVENNPLVVGAIGVGLGLLLGALMPIGGGSEVSADDQRQAQPRTRRRRRASPKRSPIPARRAKSSAARTAAQKQKERPASETAAGG